MFFFSFSSMRTNIKKNKIKDIVYENAKPIYSVLRVMGVFPFSRPTPGVTTFAIASSSMAYAGFLYVVLMVN
jgi:gustatory receptor